MDKWEYTCINMNFVRSVKFKTFVALFYIAPWYLPRSYEKVTHVNSFLTRGGSPIRTAGLQKFEEQVN